MFLSEVLILPCDGISPKIVFFTAFDILFCFLVNSWNFVSMKKNGNMRRVQFPLLRYPMITPAHMFMHSLHRWSAAKRDQ
jgi:hypothetical protein